MSGQSKCRGGACEWPVQVQRGSLYAVGQHRSTSSYYQLTITSREEVLHNVAEGML